MLFQISVRHIATDIRRTHCVICKEPISHWANHVLSARHIALRAIGNHFYSFNPPKSRHLFESGLQSALGISSSVLAKERKPVNNSRRENLKNLISHLLHIENYPMKLADKFRDGLVGNAVLRRECILLVCRLHPKWSALQVQAIVDTITTRAHLAHITLLLSIDAEFFDLESTVGHFHAAAHAKPEEIVLQTLTKHAITCIVFELYHALIWESMNHLTTVWEIYLSTRKEIVEEVQRINQADGLSEKSSTGTRGSDSHEVESVPWELPKGCISYSVPGAVIHQKLMRLDRSVAVGKGRIANAPTVKSGGYDRCHPLLQSTRKKASASLAEADKGERRTLLEGCRVQLDQMDGATLSHKM